MFRKDYHKTSSRISTTSSLNACLSSDGDKGKADI